ncbi:MAG: MFS transporter [Rhodoferax sp.]|nr:MFS transporter [Rhodoferax sp.]
MPSPLPRSFNGLAWSNLAAQSAEQLSLAATPIVAVLALGAGPGEVGLLGTAQTLPFLLLSIPLGLWADRTSRLRLLVWAESLRLLAFLGLLAVLLAGGLSLTMLALLGFLGAVGTVGFSVAAPALVPSLVPRSQLAQANGRLELARSVAFAGGPALAGALVAWAGASAAFVLAAALSVCAITLLLRLREPARPPAAPRHALLELRDGALLVWRHPLLRPVFTTSVAWNMSWFILQAAYVPYAMRLLGLDARGVGFTLAAYGAGMIVGALVARRIMGAISFGHTIVLGPSVSVLAQFTMVSTLLLPSGLLAGLAFFLFGAGPILWTISSTTLRQTVTPHAMLSRVSAIFVTGGWGVRPLGAALGGLVGATWGEPACLVLAMAGFVLQAWLVWASPLRRLQVLPEAVE